MMTLLEQFLSETRDVLQSIDEMLMALESAPDNEELMTELFRLVHTLKGNSGLFEFPEMTRVLHACEDLMDAVRHGYVAYSNELADRLLDTMDFVGVLCSAIESENTLDAHYAADSAKLATALRHLITHKAAALAMGGSDAEAVLATSDGNDAHGTPPPVSGLIDIPEAIRMSAYRRAAQGVSLHWLVYGAAEECFFQGDDPFFQARGTPELLWGGIRVRQQWPALVKLDAYRCMLDFHMLTSASRASLLEYYRYMPDQVAIVALPAIWLVLPQGQTCSSAVYGDLVLDMLDSLQDGDTAGLGVRAQTLLENSNPASWLASALRWLLLVLEIEPTNNRAIAALIESFHDFVPPAWSQLTSDAGAEENRSESSSGDRLVNSLSPEQMSAVMDLIAVQRQVLQLPIETDWQLGRTRAVAVTLAGCLKARGKVTALASLDDATAATLQAADTTPLLCWIDTHFADDVVPGTVQLADSLSNDISAASVSALSIVTDSATTEVDVAVKVARRTEEGNTVSKSLKVDQVKIDRLMNLIGEIVVAKNALPYLAGRAELVFGVRELAREIKTQYAVINRIAEEMQSAIIQVRMMPVSFVFQRFPRLVRDISRKLGKDIDLLLEGEDTEADKNIIESLGDPLMHIVRNSLDHGFELPEVRGTAGKSATGTLIIRANQESDRVIIEIADDGKGIDPEVIKRKAYEKGIIDEVTLDRLSDQDAINLVFAAGFSTAEVISDLSGRGVGMDVVRTAVERVNGTITLQSEVGKGTCIRLSLPLSMAVSNVMIVESNGQAFGIPMDQVLETVRVPRADIRTIKKSLTTVLRGCIVPLKSINGLLGLSVPPLANEQDELAVLVVRLGDESVGLLVDDFRETVDIILKPMIGVLGGLSGYSGSALMGDGSVLMVLNVKELI